MKWFLKAVMVAVALISVSQLWATEGSYTNTSAETKSVVNQNMDGSSYASQDDRIGLIVAHWNVERYGATNVILAPTIPQGAIIGIEGAVIDVTTAITPAGVTGSVVAILGSDTTNEVATIYDKATSWTKSVTSTNSGIYKATADLKLYMKFVSTTAPTNGGASIYIPYWRGNR
jgi:hypothetical protein